MIERRFRTSDGRSWRVWAVRPGSLADERRRAAERRLQAGGRPPNPPGIERRSGRDRRADAARAVRLRASRVLPEAWRDGWLVFEPEDQHGGAARRLPSIPSDWESCSDVRLGEYLQNASERRQAG